MSVATGTPWLGTYKVKAGPVVYIVAEGAGGFAKRLQAWKLSHGVASAMYLGGCAGPYWTMSSSVESSWSESINR